MSRPVIGISAYLEPSSWGAWDSVPAVVLQHDYVRQVEQAGGIALLIPPRLDADTDLVHEILARVDGVMIAGGADVDPDRYGAERHRFAQASRPDRDATEIALAQATAERDLPILGICRGMQVMAVAAGGTLEQHLPDRVGHGEHAPFSGRHGSHPVTTVEGSAVRALLGERLAVPTYHHQAVHTHPGYEAAAWADDGTLEAMEQPRARFRLAVQWHPEAGVEAALFHALVDACR
ncbi:MAG TPA: gamma-glutamyl-gamma-aminobutyrate hydrolase family protein [Dermatophilaceae bacterium]|nr:gamma-glutamyl-gamma-aminobutyrate hydrolase family protein [Dermatophilaceae bacterium]